MRKLRPRLRLHLRLAALLLAVLCGVARGQTSFGEELEPALSREDYRVLVARLELTKAQREAADRLFEGYQAEHARNAAALRKAWNESRKGWKQVDGEWVQDPELQKLMSEATTKYAERKPGAQREFLRELKSLLEESQAGERWERAERLVRRQMMDRLSARGAVECQRVDLMRGVLMLELPAEEQAKVAGLLEEYEALADKPLRRMEPVRGKPGEDAERVWNEGVMELRSLNRRYLRLVVQELGAESGARLKRWARDRAYWQMAGWSSPSARQGAEDCRRLGTLTGEQEARITALLAEIEPAAAELRTKAEPAYDEVDEKMVGLSEREWHEAMNRPDNPLVLLSSEWGGKYNELYLQWETRLEEILTPEQRRGAWPPSGKLQDAMIERSIKRWE